MIMTPGLRKFTLTIHVTASIGLARSLASSLVLLVLTALSVYKLQGMTPYRWRKQHEQRKESLS